MLFLDLPEDAWKSIAVNLSAPDVLSFLSVHRRINDSLGKSSAFWQLLLKRDTEYEEEIEEEEGSATATSMRKAFMIHAYRTYVPSIRWYPVERGPVSAREGHIACALSGPGKEKRICINGGFSDDSGVYLVHVPSSKDSTWSWSRLQPPQPASFVYGASLTTLDSGIKTSSSSHVARAVRFGGFQSGGYSHETNQVSVLTIKDEKKGDDDGNELSTSANWEVIPTINSNYVTPRAYHTATLIGGRYLLIIGGMMWRESILNEAILDTKTWTWLTEPISQFSDQKPSGRHGHSAIFDSKRNRVLLFGGGSGTDLLRSGSDNAEVWELKMNKNWKTELQFPWTWSKVLGDEVQDSEESDEMEVEADNDTVQTLSPAASLCLGRCHNAVKLSQESVLLLFGSGRPSTNGAILFDLQTDTWRIPKPQGPLPKAHFSGIAVFLESEGYLLVHGGYSSQDSDAIRDMSVLDLAPYTNRDFNGLRVLVDHPGYRQVTDEEAEMGRQNRNSRLQQMLLLEAQYQQMGEMFAHGGMGLQDILAILSSNEAANNAEQDDSDDSSYLE